uniref:Uncharacterized protein n=1 Tax=Cannabis sativa TaxID=3483 RepID=A0A803QW92_CANSA
MGMMKIKDTFQQDSKLCSNLRLVHFFNLSLSISIYLKLYKVKSRVINFYFGLTPATTVSWMVREWTRGHPKIEQVHSCVYALSPAVCTNKALPYSPYKVLRYHVMIHFACPSH